MATFYDFENRTAFNPETGEGTPNAVGQVYAKTDTTFSTPLVVTLMGSGLSVTDLTTDQYCQLQGFQVVDLVQVVFKSGDFTKVLNTTTPLVGPAGPAVSDAVDNGDNTVTFLLEDGSPAATVTLPEGPQGDPGPQGLPATGAADDDAAIKTFMTTPGTETNTALNATIAGEVAPVEAAVTVAGARPNTWASIGDSISAAGRLTLNGQLAPELPRRSWQAHANIYLGQRLEPVNVLAVSGKRADEVLAEQVPELLALNPRPGYCAVMAGTNDINAGQTDVQVIASLQGILEELLATNIRPIIGTIPPRTGFAGAQITYHHRVNAWIRATAPRMGAILVDWFPPMANADGTPKANVHQDGLHPTPYGAALMGKAFYDAVKNVIPEATKLPASNAESPNPVLTSNPLMTGTTGTASAGGTGSVATSYLVAGAGGQAYTAALSKVARTDGVPGDWQQAVISGSTSIQLYQKIAAAGRYAGGDTVYALIEFEADADLTAATEFAAQTLTFPTGKNATALAKIGGDTYTGPVVVPNKGVIRTPDVQLPADVTELWALIKVVGGNGTIRIGRVSVQKVT